MAKSYYYPTGSGITGYDIWRCNDDADYVMVLYVGAQREQIAHKYKVQHTPGGRPYVRPNGRRIYIDELFA